MNKDLKSLIEEQFKKDNFLILENKTNSAEKCAVVYCSSNGVYRNDTVEDFTESILKTDNYEWYMNRIPYAEKHIFIRDVSKRFYQCGINEQLNTFAKVAERIKQETKDYKIITIGSSSGGLMAVILSKLLNAEFSIAFSPILKTIRPDMSNQDAEERFKKNELFDYSEYANTDIPIFFIYPNGSGWDIYNSSLLKDNKNVYFLPIKSDIHGVPINKRILKKIISLSKEELKKLCCFKTTDSVTEYQLAKNWGIKFYLLRVFDYIKKYPLFFARKDFYNLVLK